MIRFKMSFKKVLFSSLLLLGFFSFGSNQINAQTAPFVDADCGFKVECVDPANCLSGANNILLGTKKVKFSFDLSKIPGSFWPNYPDYDPKNGIPDILDKNLNSFPIASIQCINRDQFPKTTSGSIADERPSNLFDCNFKDEKTGDYQFYLRTKDVSHDWFDLCIGNYSIVKHDIFADIKVTSLNGLSDIESEWKVEVTFLNKSNIPVYRTFLDNINLNNHPAPLLADVGTLSKISDKSDIWFILKPQTVGTHFIEISSWSSGELINSAVFTVFAKDPPICVNCGPHGSGKQIPCSAYECKDCSICRIPTPTPSNAPICQQCGPGKIPCSDTNCQSCSQCRPTATPVQPYPSLAPICDQLPDTDNFRGACWECINQQGRIWTAIGCLPTDLGIIIKEQIFGFGLSIAGAIAFLYFLYGAFLFLTSRGNPEQIAQGREIIISSLTGLLLIIFSVFLLRVVGIDILKLPGFT